MARRQNPRPMELQVMYDRADPNSALRRRFVTCPTIHDIPDWWYDKRHPPHDTRTAGSDEEGGRTLAYAA